MSPASAACFGGLGRGRFRVGVAVTLGVPVDGLGVPLGAGILRSVAAPGDEDAGHQGGRERPETDEHRHIMPDLIQSPG